MGRARIKGPARQEQTTCLKGDLLRCTGVPGPDLCLLSGNRWGGSGGHLSEL